MPFIDRDEAGKIRGVYACKQRDGQEWIEEDHADLAVYSEGRSIAEQEQGIKATLAAIDLKSIRSLREWLAAQDGAPQFIKDHEAAAIVERAKL